MSVIYIIAAICSLLCLVTYSIFIKKKFPWFWVLFSSIFVVNIGYFSISISKTLEEALLANRIAYLGSVFLPLSMLLIILNATGLDYKKWLWIPLTALGVCVFLITASYPYSNIYYEFVSLNNINGVSVLNKDYGSWHSLYMVYLLGYFVVMIAAVIHATMIKKITSIPQVIMLLGAVFVNICVWAIEQFVDIPFEFLAISYIITDLFLIGVYALLQDTEKRIKQAQEQLKSQDINSNEKNTLYSKEVIEIFNCGVLSLTQTESIIYNLYLEGKGTKDVLAEMNIKENTLKYHNKNIYGKLGVSSRRELIAIASEINKTVS